MAGATARQPWGRRSKTAADTTFGDRVTKAGNDETVSKGNIVLPSFIARQAMLTPIVNPRGAAVLSRRCSHSRERATCWSPWRPFHDGGECQSFSAEWPLASISQRTHEAERKTPLVCNLPSSQTASNDCRADAFTKSDPR